MIELRGRGIVPGVVEARALVTHELISGFGASTSRPARSSSPDGDTGVITLLEAAPAAKGSRQRSVQ